MFSRRQVLVVSFAAAGMTVAALTARRRYEASTAERFEINLTDAEWKAKLSEDEYLVLRTAATEQPHSSPLNQEKRDGTYACAGCDLPLFSSYAKFESGTGWPSFFEPIAGAVGAKPDFGHLLKRTEAHCSRCGGHLGHIFDDGPDPTGMRYCLNGLALKFRPAVA